MAENKFSQAKTLDFRIDPSEISRAGQAELNKSINLAGMAKVTNAVVEILDKHKLDKEKLEYYNYMGKENKLETEFAEKFADETLYQDKEALARLNDEYDAAMNNLQTELAEAPFSTLNMKRNQISFDSMKGRVESVRRNNIKVQDHKDAQNKVLQREFDLTTRASNLSSKGAMGLEEIDITLEELLKVKKDQVKLGMATETKAMGDASIFAASTMLDTLVNSKLQAINNDPQYFGTAPETVEAKKKAIDSILNEYTDEAIVKMAQGAVEGLDGLNADVVEETLRTSIQGARNGSNALGNIIADNKRRVDQKVNTERRRLAKEQEDARIKAQEKVKKVTTAAVTNAPAFDTYNMATEEGYPNRYTERYESTEDDEMVEEAYNFTTDDWHDSTNKSAWAPVMSTTAKAEVKKIIADNSLSLDERYDKMISTGVTDFGRSDQIIPLLKELGNMEGVDYNYLLMKTNPSNYTEEVITDYTNKLAYNHSAKDRQTVTDEIRKMSPSAPTTPEKMAILLRDSQAKGVAYTEDELYKTSGKLGVFYGSANRHGVMGVNPRDILDRAAFAGIEIDDERAEDIAVEFNNNLDHTGAAWFQEELSDLVLQEYVNERGPVGSGAFGMVTKKDITDEMRTKAKAQLLDQFIRVGDNALMPNLDTGGTSRVINAKPLINRIAGPQDKTQQNIDPKEGL